jgi:hypothetical protein
MANSDKNILITPATGTSGDPTIVFTGTNATPITQRILDAGTISYQATAGELLSIADGLTGTLFAVNDISGMPMIEVTDVGFVHLVRYGGYVGVGGLASNSWKLQVYSDAVLGTTGNQGFAGLFRVPTGGNTDILEITSTRWTTGTSWTSSGMRMQQKVDGTYMAYIQFNNPNQGLSIGTGGAGTPLGVTERMLIDSSGQVLIGTSVIPSFGGRLNIGALQSSASAITIMGRPSDSLADIYFYSNNAATQYANIESGPTYLLIGTSGSERVRIDGNGKMALSAIARDNSNQVRNITFSTSAASAGQDGDVWIQYV